MESISLADLDRLMEAEPPTPKDGEIIKQCHAALERGNLDEARFLALQVVTLRPEAPRSYLLLSDVCGMAGRFEAAKAVAEKAISLAPELAAPYVKLAQAHEMTGDLVAGVAALQKATSCLPDDPDLQLRLGRIAITAGQREVASAAFCAAVELEAAAQDKAVEALTNLISLAPQKAAKLAHLVAQRFDDSALLNAVAAESYLRGGQPTVALRYIETGGSSRALFDERLHIRALLDLGRVEDAWSICRRVLRRGTQDRHIRRLAALTARFAGRAREAREYYEKLLAVGEKDPRIHMGHGIVLEQEGFLNESLRAFQQVAEQAPNDPEPHMNRARVFDQLGQSREAGEAPRMARHRFGAPMNLLEMPKDLQPEDTATCNPDNWKRILQTGLLSDGERVAILHALARSAQARDQLSDASKAYAQANARFRRRIEFDAAQFRQWLRSFVTHQKTKPQTPLTGTQAFRCRPLVLMALPCRSLEEIAEKLAEHPECQSVPIQRLNLLLEDALEAETDLDEENLVTEVTAFRETLDSLSPKEAMAPFFIINPGLTILSPTLMQRLFPDAFFVTINQVPEEAARELYMDWRTTSDPWSNDWEECLSIVTDSFRLLVESAQHLPDERTVWLTSPLGESLQHLAEGIFERILSQHQIAL